MFTWSWRLCLLFKKTLLESKLMGDISSFNLTPIAMMYDQSEVPFGPRRVQKRSKSSDEFCLHGPGGFVCCLRKHFWNQNWWGTFQALIWHQLQWCSINLRCLLVQKGSKKGPKAVTSFVYMALEALFVV